MPEKTSIFTDAVTNVAGFVMELREEAKKANPVPFMEERVSLEQARNRWAKMGEQQKREYIKAHGLQEALKLVKPRGFAGRG